MAETSKNKIYYNDDENSVADVLTDMKKLAQSVDNAIEKSKYDDTQIKTNISNIQTEQIEQNTELEELRAENARLREDLNGLPKGQASGENIDLSDSAEMRCELKISGNSKQETREGYNILPNNVTTMNISGVDFKVNKNGTVLVNGTPTANAVLQLNTGITYSAGTYKLSGCPKGGSDFTYRFDLMNKANNNIPVIDTGNAAEFTITEETTFIPRIRIQSGVTINNLLFEPMLVSDTSKTKYEPYGASPSSEYPSENECCGDNINLFNKADTTENTSISVNDGTTYANNNSFSTNFIKIKGIKDICCNALSSDTTLWGATYDENKNYIKGFTTTDGILSQTVLSGATYVRLGILKKYLDTTKIEKGTTQTPYSKYGQGCINEVICNKNLFNFDIYNNTTIGCTTSGDKSKLTINGTTIGPGSIFSTLGDIETYRYLGKYKAGEYWFRQFVISGSMDIGGSAISGAGHATYIKKSDKTQLAFIGNLDNYNRAIILTEDTDLYVQFFVNSADITYNNLTLGFELEKRNTPIVEYVEHKSQTYTIPTQQPFRECGDIRDTFIKKNNKWYERHYIPRKIFDGTEDWSIQGNSFEYSIPKSSIININAPASTLNIVSNYFKIIKNNALEVGTFRAGGQFLNFNYDNGNGGIEDFKSWLTAQYNAGTPVYIDYVLAEPIDIECTEEQSTILFEIEQNAKTYDKVTHIYSIDEVSPNIELTYKKDIETLFNNTLVS